MNWILNVRKPQSYILFLSGFRYNRAKLCWIIEYLLTKITFCLIYRVLLTYKINCLKYIANSKYHEQRHVKTSKIIGGGKSILPEALIQLSAIHASCRLWWRNQWSWRVTIFYFHSLSQQTSNTISIFCTSLWS